MAQLEHYFPNGRGVSVIDDGYGASTGLYELAVLSPDGKLDYSTPITGDVLGYLTPAEVIAAADAVAALPPKMVGESNGRPVFA